MTAQPITEVNGNVLVPATGLREALSATVVSAGTDSMIPVLCAVRIVKEGNVLTFTSTDRYRLTRVTMTLDATYTDTPGWAILVPLADVKRIVTALPKTHKRNVFQPEAGLAVTDGRLTFEHDGTTLTATGLDNEYPNVDRIISTGEAVATEGIGFNPKFLADVAKLPFHGSDPAVFTFYGSTKPAVIRWDNGPGSYVHMIMPAGVTS